MARLCLDTSSIVKRYVIEEGTEVVDEIFDRAEAGELHIIFSIWNVGEVIGVLHERLRRGWMSEEEFNSALRKFGGELVKLLRLGTLEIVPVLTSVLADSWAFIVNYSLYEVDGLQLSTHVHGGGDALLSADKRLVAAARKAELQAHDISREEKQIRELIQD